MSAGYVHDHDKHFAKMYPSIIHSPRLTDGAVRLYSHMLWRYGSNRDNHEGRRSMADFMGVSEATISKRIRELEADDLVVVIERGYDAGTGKYQTPFYHVFLHRDDARNFRARYNPKEGERVRPKPGNEARRKSRKGVGGKPSHNPVNLSSPGELELTNPENLSSHELDTDELDTITCAPSGAAGDIPETTFQSPRKVCRKPDGVFDVIAERGFAVMGENKPAGGRVARLAKAARKVWQTVNGAPDDPTLVTALNAFYMSYQGRGLTPPAGVDLFETRLLAFLQARLKRENAPTAPVKVIPQEDLDALLRAHNEQRAQAMRAMFRQKKAADDTHD